MVSRQEFQQAIEMLIPRMPNQELKDHEQRMKNVLGYLEDDGHVISFVDRGGGMVLMDLEWFGRVVSDMVTPHVLQERSNPKNPLKTRNEVVTRKELEDHLRKVEEVSLMLEKNEEWSVGGVVRLLEWMGVIHRVTLNMGHANGNGDAGDGVDETDRFFIPSRVSTNNEDELMLEWKKPLPLSSSASVSTLPLPHTPAVPETRLMKMTIQTFNQAYLSHAKIIVLWSYFLPLLLSPHLQTNAYFLPSKINTNKLK